MYKNLKQYKKAQLMDKYKLHEGDVGSVVQQIALMSQKILDLAKHLKSHKNDICVARRLDQYVANRRSLIKYAEKRNITTLPQYSLLASDFNLKRSNRNIM
jgi:small subunit ribosomal protein S15